MSQRLIPAAAILLLCAIGVWLTFRTGATPEQPPSVEPEHTSNTVQYETPDDPTPDVSSPDWFVDVTAETGIDFVHDSGTSDEKPFPAANGSGLGTVDFDCDGLPDLCFLSGTDFPVDLQGGHQTIGLYRNQSEWSFLDVTRNSGIDHRGYAAGLAVGDFDSDGFPDLYINCYGPNALLRNLGDGTFEPIPDSCGALDERWGTSAAFMDIDNDGLQDIYVCNYAEWSLETNQFCGDRDRGVRLYCSPRSVKSVPDALFHNLGNGQFQNTFAGTSFEESPGRAQGVIASDLNNDGWIDLYIGNDLHANSLLFNTTSGGFEDVSELTGAAYDYVGNMQAGMGVASADVNRDGWFDLLVTNFEDEHNAFYENLDGTLFQEVAHTRQLAAAGLPWVGWGTAFADFNLDGWSDLVVTNGHVDNNRHLLGQSSQYEAPALLWKNGQSGFEFIGDSAGDYFRERYCGRALAVSDLDGDGDDDLVIGHQDSAPAVLANQAISSQQPQKVLRVRLIGTLSNRDATGARLVVNIAGEESPRYHQITGGGSYLSASEKQITVAVPEDQSASVTVHWPSGQTTSVVGLVAPGTLTIVETSDPAAFMSP